MGVYNCPECGSFNIFQSTVKQSTFIACGTCNTRWTPERELEEPSEKDKNAGKALAEVLIRARDGVILNALHAMETRIMARLNVIVTHLNVIDGHLRNL